MPELNDILQARIKARVCGEPTINTINFMVTSPQASFAEQAALLWSELDGALGIMGGAGVWTAGRSVQYVGTECEIADIYPGLSQSWTTPTGGVGDNVTDDAMPPNDCVCLTAKSEFRGPGGRGRMYINGYAEDGANGGYWIVEIQNAVQAIGVALEEAFGEFGTAGHRWIVLHRMQNGAPLSPPEGKPVMFYNVHNEVRSLGRRAVGRKIHRTRTP